METKGLTLSVHGHKYNSDDNLGGERMSMLLMLQSVGDALSLTIENAWH